MVPLGIAEGGTDKDETGAVLVDGNGDEVFDCFFIDPPTDVFKNWGVGDLDEVDPGRQFAASDSVDIASFSSGLVFVKVFVSSVSANEPDNLVISGNNSFYLKEPSAPDDGIVGARYVHHNKLHIVRHRPDMNGKGNHAKGPHRSPVQTN